MSAACKHEAHQIIIDQSAGLHLDICEDCRALVLYRVTGPAACVVWQGDLSDIERMQWALEQIAGMCVEGTTAHKLATDALGRGEG